MASKNTQPKRSNNKAVERSNRDSSRWVVGLLLLFLGLFAAFAVLFSFFYWMNDQSVLALTPKERIDGGVEADNPCGLLGARLGYWLADCGFGLFGLLLPLLMIMIGLRIIRQRPIWANHAVLSMVIVMLLGSLTLGYLFNHTGWLIGSHEGPGGALGNRMAELLSGAIGNFGMIIALLCGWILTGVFINRNFIDTVNRAGGMMVDGGSRLVDKVLHKEQEEGEENAEPTAAVEQTEPEPAPMPIAPVVTEEPVEEQTPTVEEAQQPVEVAAESPAQSETTDEENPFEEISVSEGGDRLVMGPNGVVVLEPRRPQRRQPRVNDENPFEEISLSNKQEKPEEVVAEPEPETSASVDLAAQFPQEIASPVIDLDELPSDEDIDPFIEEESPFEPIDLEVNGCPATPQTEPEGLVMQVKPTIEEPEASKSELKSELYDPTKDLLTYRKPPVTLLKEYASTSQVTSEELFENKEQIKRTLANFGIEIQKITATVGPTVTLYEIVQAQGVKISKIQGLEQDIAQSLKALGIRIIAPIPGKGTIGIEVPNQHKQIVSMASAVRSRRFFEFAQKAELPVVIGRTIQNENFCFDLAKLPHLLVAGATGQGKSVGLNAIIASLLYHKHPSQLKLVMVDPKMVEFSVYGRLENHFLAKMESEDKAIITDPMKAVYTLNSLCVEMENRLQLLSAATARNIVEYNNKFVQRRLNPQKGHHYMPYIVVVIDEFADLIMMAKEVERPVMRLAQKARAVGIHLIIATQRPDVKVITGGIKANFPSRIAFRVMQMIDSRTILDRPGANQLIGRGDMLFSKDGEITRIQCALIEGEEVENIVDCIARQQGYTEAYPLPDYVPEGGDGAVGEEQDLAPKKFDALFADIARDAVQSGSISTSMIQRNYEVGFNRAGRIMTQLERSGIVGRQQGAKPRDVLFYDLPSLEAKLQDLGVN